MQDFGEFKIVDYHTNVKGIVLWNTFPELHKIRLVGISFIHKQLDLLFCSQITETHFPGAVANANTLPGKEITSRGRQIQFSFHLRRPPNWINGQAKKDASSIWETVSDITACTSQPFLINFLCSVCTNIHEAYH